PSTTSISLRLADSLLDGIRQQANKMDVPYQSLMNIWLTEKLREQTGQEVSVSK
ncbi:MAG: CopG family antitoxin, partial [Betaproteobacteria bacterium]